jgi:hypothetical protein
VPVLLLVAAAAVILGGMIAVALGRGGEMTEFSADVRPVDADIATAADVALLRPPVALWGYDKRSTDEALNLVARTVTERDVEITRLRRQVADLQWAGQNRPEAQQEVLLAPEAGPTDGGETGGTQPGQAAPGSLTSSFVRREGSPSPPPAETEPCLPGNGPPLGRRPTTATQPRQQIPGRPHERRAGGAQMSTVPEARR